jgi:gamma-glutamyl-gamma-aminobutyrate hydrolase PuuD
MKKILITPRYDNVESYNEIRISLDISWLSFIKNIGFLAVIYSGELDCFVNEDVAGVIFSGGNNVNQRDCNLSELRTNAEKELFDYCLTIDLPMIGVCRGAQFLGTELGYKLEKHSNHVATRHELNTFNESRFYPDFYKYNEVNSYHEYAIKGTSKSCTTLAVTSDQSIEAWEHKKKPIMGIMWHPEREHNFSALDIELFKTIFEK